MYDKKFIIDKWKDNNTKVDEYRFEYEDAKISYINLISGESFRTLKSMSK